MSFFVYKIHCTGNGKDYVGITGNMKHRMIVHFNTMTDTVLSRTIAKYGMGMFGVTILSKEETWDAACAKEAHYIQTLNTRAPMGMNMTEGGEGIQGLRHSPDTRKRMSESHKGKGLGADNPMFGKIGANKGKTFSAETRKRMSDACKGRPSWNKGKKLSQPPWNKGKTGIYSAESLAKMGDAHRGVKASEATKRKMSVARKGLQAGERHGQAKITNGAVVAMREKYERGDATQAELGDLYGITQAMVHRIVRRKSWTHI